MSRQESEDIIRRASEKAGVEITPLTFFDRSTFTGRHMDTGDYNPHAQPLRRAVNSLHETNHRTDLETLKVNYVPKEGFGFLNNYFEHLQVCWNTVIRHAEFLLEDYDEEQRKLRTGAPKIPASYPPVLRQVLEQLTYVVEGTGWLESGLPRENIIEPQIGYSLRKLVMHLQQGQGCAHGLVGICEINKDKRK